MSVAYGIHKFTSSVTTSMKKKQVLTAFLDKYTKLLEMIYIELNNDINIATIITVVNSIKKRNPKLIIGLWYENVGPKFHDMGITYDNFTDRAAEFIQVIQDNPHFSESVRVATENLWIIIKDHISTHELNKVLFEEFQTVIKLSILYHNIE